MNETIAYVAHRKMLPALDLVCLQGPMRGKRFPLSPGRQAFGREEDNAIRLDDPTISKHHGIAEYEKDGAVIFYDTASRNGISVNGKKTPVVRLKIGREIQIGALYFKLVRMEGDERKSPKRDWRRISQMLVSPKPGLWLLASLIALPLFVLPLGSDAVRPAPPANVKEVQLKAPPSFAHPSVAKRPPAYPRQTIAEIRAQELKERGKGS